MSLIPLKIERAEFGYPNRVTLYAEDLQIDSGQLVLLTGRNGTGKSTLIKSVCGLLKPLGGHVRLSGAEISTLSPVERARRVAVVLTERIHLAGMDVLTLVELGRFPHGTFNFRSNPDDRRKAELALMKTGMQDFAGRTLDQLSDGELQKVMVARALCQDTPLIVLDEPTAFLDYEAREELLNLLHELAAESGRSVLFSSHDIAPAERVADLRWHLEDHSIMVRKLK